MRPTLLDTDVLVYWSTNHPTYARYRELLAGFRWLASAITVGEIRLLTLRDGMPGAEKIETRLKLGGIGMLPVDDLVARTWAEMTAALGRSAGKQTNDLWIAATAIAHGLPLVTNNPKDFEGIEGLDLITR